MCNEIYVPNDAFIVEDKNTSFCDAVISKETIEKYNKHYYNLIQQGYSKEDAKQKADQRLEQYFDIYMAKYQKKYCQEPYEEK